MPGGVQAIKQPWRNTYAQILNSMDWDSFIHQFGYSELAGFLASKPIATLQTMINNQINSPQSSSAGRLFDAVAGALGLCTEQVQFEGQAAIELEMLADAESVVNGSINNPYKFTIEKILDATGANSLIDLNAGSIWPQLLNDLQQGESKSIIASRFHAGLIEGIMKTIDLVQERFNVASIVLSGGCLQNAILLQGLEQAIKKRQLKCISHALVPANDGGIALGQAAIAAARIISTQ
jgi:hydrogenase maturation protein HypF